MLLAHLMISLKINTPVRYVIFLKKHGESQVSSIFWVWFGLVWFGLVWFGLL
ncbi:TPA_asm: hypothetical protein G4A15_002988 [Salmonella enterica subsp. enterica serovar Oranienburg]|uniref:Uncharacterized protein n=1 Tax=Salmonella oranienberg TaxID=28147 RepID=A0A730E9W5_SALON|nr:hypothetical protein [Salmonella enterica subsp. enterica serovar Oranienburg]